MRVMPLLPAATAAALAERAQDLLRDAADLTSGRDPNYIRDAQPESIFEAIPLAAARQGCRRYADNPEEYSGRRQARVERACRPYLDSLEYGEGPSIELPFRGGQCAGTNYRIQCQTTVFPTADCTPTNNAFSTFANGPISGPFTDSVSPPAAGPLCQGTSGTRVFMRIGPNQDILGLAGASYGARISGLTVTPNSGPDNCGNPPTEIVGPVPPPVPGPVTEPFVRVPDINIDIGVEVNPDLTIDVDFGTGPITIDPFGDEEGGGGGGGAGGPGTPGGPSDTGQGGEADGEAGEGQVLTGLRINFVEPPVGGNEYAEGVYRGVCYIYMGTAEGLDHDPAGAMLRDGQFVYAEKDFLTRWAVTANPGYNLRVTPYYRPAEAKE